MARTSIQRLFGYAIVAVMGLLTPFAITGMTPASANTGFHGNGTCPHDNGTADSSACYYGQVQYNLNTTATPSYPNAGFINYIGDQLRQRVTVFGGPSNQFFEVGFDQFYPNGFNYPVYSPYALTLKSDGSWGWGWTCNMNAQQIQDAWTLDDDYAGNGNWVGVLIDQNGSNGGSCNFVTQNIYNGIYGGAVSEGGSVFCYGCRSGGFFGGADTSYMNTFNVLTTQICLAYDPPGSICGGPYADWSTYETDYACPGPACMNGDFFSSDFWSSNMQGS